MPSVGGVKGYGRVGKSGVNDRDRDRYKSSPNAKAMPTHGVAIRVRLMSGRCIGC